MQQGHQSHAQARMPSSAQFSQGSQQHQSPGVVPELASKATKRTSAIEAETAAPKVSKTDIPKISPKNRYKTAMEAAAAVAAAKEKTKKMLFSCILCVSNEHKTTECDIYGTISKRKLRMAELGICSTCGRGHTGTCKFKSSLQCEICQALHLPYLCTNTFEE
uniref:Uncharacterized protein n=1 Tax=Caenorhabditis japonica TaxID=281687 RepID=A0A8R1EC77_CAEJA